MNYQAIHLIYQFTGKDLDIEKLQKAVTFRRRNIAGYPRR
jgi:hypothetical protein